MTKAFSPSARARGKKPKAKGIGTADSQRIEAAQASKFNLTPLFYLGLILYLASILKLFLTPGHTYSLDGAPHSARVYMLFESLQAGELPLWSNKWYAGYPLLQFYSPLFFYLAAGLNFLLHNIQQSIKVWVFLLHLFSGISAFLLVKEITQSRRAAFVGGVAYALSPWHVFQLLHFARFPVSLVYAFLPLPFLFFERYKNHKLSLLSGLLLAGASISLLMFSHYGYTLFVSIIFSLYLLVDSFNFQKARLDKSRLLFLLGTGLTALLLSLYIVLPILLEDKYVVGMGGAFSRQGFLTDSATIQSLVERRAGPVYHKGYLGVSFILLSLVGIGISIRKKKLTPPLLYGASLYLVLGSETALYKYIPFIYSQQNTGRLIIYLIFFMSILAGEGYLGLERLAEKVGNKKGGYFVFTIIAILCYLDVSIMADLSWPATHGMEAVYQDFNRRIDLQQKPGARNLQLAEDPNLDWRFGVIFSSVSAIEIKAPILSNFFYQGGPMSLPYLRAGKEWVLQELRNERGIHSSADFLYLMNTPHVLLIDRQGRISFLEVQASPLVAAPKLAFTQNEPSGKKDNRRFLRLVIEEMDINKQLNTAARILIPPGESKIEKPTTTDPLTIHLLDYQQDLQQTMLRVESSANCYLQLSHSYYHYLRVYIDGQESQYFPTALRLIGLYLPQGEHQIRIEPYLSPLRKICLILNLLMVGGVAFILAVSRRDSVE